MIKKSAAPQIKNGCVDKARAAGTIPK